MNEFAAFAKQLVLASAPIIKSYYRTDFTVDRKANSSPVTIADRKAEEVMREMIMKTYPDHGIIGEEFGNHQPDADYQWTLDPIDGTKNFVAGSFLFGTLVGLMYKGKAQVGTLYHPITDHLLLGYDNTTWLNEEQVQVRPCDKIEDALLLATSVWGVEHHFEEEPFINLSRRVERLRTWGDCHGYFLVATGAADIMVDPAMHPWDLVPLIPIIQGAGGTITDWHGNPPDGARSAVATGGSIHQAVISALNP